MGSFSAIVSRPHGLAVETGHEIGLGLVLLVYVAAGARGDEPQRIAGPTGVQVIEARPQLDLERGELLDLLLGLAQLVAVHLADTTHRIRRAARFLPALEDLLDLVEREAHVLQLRDPADP